MSGEYTKKEIMNKRYKIIAVDMDGTMLQSDKTIHSDSVCDIQAAAKKGIQVVYCTGRALSELQPYVKILPEVRYAVCYSGAVVYDCAENKRIYHMGIEQIDSKKIIETAKNYRAMIHFLTEEESIVASSDVTHMEDFHMGVYQAMYMKVTRKVADMEDERKLHDSIAKINIYFRAAEDRNKAYDELKELPLTFAFAEETSLEMTAQGVTKATGLERLAEYLQVPMCQIAGIGDADNDRDMLKTVGFSVAMGNAGEDIKNNCDFITKDNDHNGVGEAIRYIMSNRS